jgi:hypothetical protein
LVGQSATKPAEFYFSISEDGNVGQCKSIFIQKCIQGLTQSFKDQIEAQAKKIYETTIIKKIPTYIKKILEQFPSKKQEIVDQMITNFPHKEKPIVTMLIYQRFILKLADLLDSFKLDTQDQIFRVVIENMANLDVEVKMRKRKGTHLVKTEPLQDKKAALNTIFNKIESREQY